MYLFISFLMNKHKMNLCKHLECFSKCLHKKNICIFVRMYIIAAEIRIFSLHLKKKI